MNKEIKRICGKKPEEITMVEYQNLKLSMLKQLGDENGTCEGVWCEDCCLGPANIIGNSCSTVELTDTQKAIELVQDWHKEHTLKIDWSKVPIDARVIVWDNDLKNYKVKRHFAKFENGEIYAWNNGETSWSSEKDKYCVSKWDNAELAEVADD